MKNPDFDREVPRDAAALVPSDSVAPVSKSDNNIVLDSQARNQLTPQEKSLFGELKIEGADQPQANNATVLEPKLKGAPAENLVALVPTEAPVNSVRTLENSFKLPSAVRGAPAVGEGLGAALGIGALVGVGVGANLYLFYKGNEHKNNSAQNDRAERSNQAIFDRFNGKQATDGGTIIINPDGSARVIHKRTAQSSNGNQSTDSSSALPAERITTPAVNPEEQAAIRRQQELQLEINKLNQQVAQLEIKALQAQTEALKAQVKVSEAQLNQTEVRRAYEDVRFALLANPAEKGFENYISPNLGKFSRVSNPDGRDSSTIENSAQDKKDYASLTPAERVVYLRLPREDARYFVSGMTTSQQDFLVEQIKKDNSYDLTSGVRDFMKLNLALTAAKNEGRLVLPGEQKPGESTTANPLPTDLEKLKPQPLKLTPQPNENPGYTRLHPPNESEKKEQGFFPSPAKPLNPETRQPAETAPTNPERSPEVNPQASANSPENSRPAEQPKASASETGKDSNGAQKDSSETRRDTSSETRSSSENTTWRTSEKSDSGREVVRIPDDAVPVGEGREAKVYKGPDGKAYKVFKESGPAAESMAAKEFETSQKLTEMGIPHARVEKIAQTTDGKTVVIEDCISGKDTKEYLRTLRDPAKIDDVKEQVKEIYAKLAKAGYHVPDSNLKNQMVGDDGRVYLIDVKLSDSGNPAKEAKQEGELIQNLVEAWRAPATQRWNKDHGVSGTESSHSSARSTDANVPHSSTPEISSPENPATQNTPTESVTQNWNVPANELTEEQMQVIRDFRKLSPDEQKNALSEMTMFDNLTDVRQRPTQEEAMQLSEMAAHLVHTNPENVTILTQKQREDLQVLREFQTLPKAEQSDLIRELAIEYGTNKDPELRNLLHKLIEAHHGQ